MSTAFQRFVQLTAGLLAESTLEGVLRQAAAAALELSGARLAVAGQDGPDGWRQADADAGAGDQPFEPPAQALYRRIGSLEQPLRLTGRQLSADPGRWGPAAAGPVPRGLLAVPLLASDGRPEGLIAVAGGEQGRFSADDEALLSQLAAVTSVALRQAGAVDLCLEAEQERDQMADLLRRLDREEKTLQALIDNTHAQLAYLDSELRFVYVNLAYAQGSGHSREVLLGRRHFDLFPNAENEAIFKRVLDSGQPVEYVAKPFEFADQPERGVTYWDWRLAPVRDGAGSVVGLVLSLTDVTAQAVAKQQVEQWAREAEQRAAVLDATFTAMKNGAMLYGADGKIVRMNDMARTILGYGLPDQSRPFKERVAAMRIVDGHGRTMAFEEMPGPRSLAGETVAGMIMSLYTRGDDEEPIWVLASAAPVRATDGRLMGAVTTFADVTELRATQGRLEAANAALETQAEELEVQAEELRTQNDELLALTVALNAERARLATMLAVAHDMASTLDIGALLGTIVDRLQDIVPYTGLAIYRVEGRELVVVEYRGPEPRPAALGQRIHIEKAIGLRAILSHREPVLEGDLNGETAMAWAWQHSDRSVQHRLLGPARSWLAVPLICKERVIGVLRLSHDEPNRFSPHHAMLALAFANHAAVAMENAWLYEQAAEAATLQERQRLARDLHDAVSQTLFSASLTADVLPRLWQQDPATALPLLQDLRELTRGARAEMRMLLFELRPQALGEASLDVLVQHLAEAVTGRARIPVKVEVKGHCPALPPQVQLGLYRIAQEALNNVVKHARAGRATIQVCCTPAGPGVESPGRLELTIADDGAGFDPERVPPGRLGLNIMAERALTIGASLAVNSQPGRGTRVSISWQQVPNANAG